MRSLICILCLVLAVIAAGCTAGTPATTTPVPAAPVATPIATAAPATLPSLAGNWSGPMTGYQEDLGFTSYPNVTLTMAVLEQDGRIFWAGWSLLITVKSSAPRPSPARSNATTGISRWSSRAGGTSTGAILGTDEIEITYQNAGSPYTVSIDTLKRT